MEFAKHESSYMLPTLYKKNSAGKVQQWDIYVEGPTPQGPATIVVEHGLVGGKIQKSEDVVSMGKNIGKANETTPLEQALSEAQSKWTKRQDKGYKSDKAALDVDDRPGAGAMLAHRYDKYPHKIDFPCIVQPKFDGHRCMAVVKNGKCTLWSRGRKQITGLPHIEREIEALVATQALGIGVDSGYVLDGELYNHEYKDRFEELSSFIRNQEPKEGHEVVQYHIYDWISDLDYEKRADALHNLFEINKPNACLVRVQSLPADQDEVVPYFKSFLEHGYEGAMLRNLKGGYAVDKRSYDLQKVKEFDDAEFKITGVKEGRGKLKGHAIFECTTAEGATFDVKLQGNLSVLAEIFANVEMYIGRDLTVQYQGFTNGGVPRFPVGLRVRD